MPRTDGNVYFRPSQDEIRARREILDWMQLMDWEWALIDSIMYHDNPTPDDVRRLVYSYGPIDALRRIRRVVY